MTPRATAVFDLDGTITEGDTYLAFLLFVLARRPTRLPHCLGLIPTVLASARGRMPRDEVKRRFLQRVLGPMPCAEVAELAGAFVPRCMARMIRPLALERIAWHRQRGDRLVLVTASLDIIAVGLGQALGFDDVLATKVAWSDGRLSGQLDGPNLLYDHKLAALLRLGIGPRPRDGEVFAYSDHDSDLPLLLFADHPVAVDPSPRLAAEAAARGISVQSWKCRRGSQAAGSPPR